MDIQEKIRNKYSVAQDGIYGKDQPDIAPLKPAIVTPDGKDTISPSGLYTQ